MEYLYWYFQSRGYWEQIADEKKGTGQPNLNGSKLAKIKVPVAPPHRQHRSSPSWTTCKSSRTGRRHSKPETAAELDALLPAILDRAFKGELI